MSHGMNFSQKAGVVKGRTPQKNGTVDGFKPAGWFKVEHVSGGKVISTQEFSNGITNEGKDALLDIMFEDTAKIATWNMGLVISGGTLAAGDTYAQINGSNGWTEYEAYEVGGDAAARGEWATDAASGQSITNTTQTIFDIDTDSGSVSGLFIVGGPNSTATQGDSASVDAVLWSTADFTQGITAVNDGDQLKVTYTVNITA